VNAIGRRGTNLASVFSPNQEEISVYLCDSSVSLCVMFFDLGRES